MRPAIVNVMDRAARRAGRGLARDFGEIGQLQASRRGTADFVAAAGARAGETLHGELRRARPAFGFLAPKDKAAAGDGPRWIVEPLDGAANFLHGLPRFAISIAIEERDRIAAGIVYDPLTDELFWAERNAGAFLNDTRLRVSARQRMSECLVATGIPPAGHGARARHAATLRAVTDRVAGIRCLGSAALDLAYVAAGRCDGCWGFGAGIPNIAAGVLIVREAGGFVSDPAGRDAAFAAGEIVAANDRIHEELRDCVRAADPGPQAAQ